MSPDPAGGIGGLTDEELAPVYDHLRDYSHTVGDARKRHDEAARNHVAACAEPDACCGRDGWPDTWPDDN